MSANQDIQIKEDSLRALLAEVRPTAELPPRFQDGVWRRIQREEASDNPTRLPYRTLQGWLDRLLLPRVALAGLAAFLVAGSLTGFASGKRALMEKAQERYVAAVAPGVLH